MENQFKLRISRMIRSSFGSCRSRYVSDVIETPVFVPQNRQHHQLIELFSPKPRPFPSICRPKCSEPDETVEGSCIIRKDLFPRRKVSDQNSLLFSAVDGRNHPPASPISPLNKKTHLRKKTKKKTHLKNKKCEKDQLGSFMADNYKGYWFNSDDGEDDETTLFSSKSLTSDSSDSFRQNKARRRHKPAGTRKETETETETETSLMPLEGKVKDSFAVVKRSSDPYNDFRTSMVEMIVEKQIFAGKDLENLLQCFLSLNSYHHHGVIIEVFTEIWEALFSNWS